MNEITPASQFIPEHYDVIREFGTKDRHVGDDETPWIPYVAEGAFWKPLRFDLASGRVWAMLWVQGPGIIGRHQHHGSVVGFVVEGSWYYKEYDWVATPGSMISEAPGGIHTLVTDHPTGMKSLFVTEGVMEFFGDDGGYAGSQSMFWNIDEYVKHCRKHNLKINEKLFY